MIAYFSIVNWSAADQTPLALFPIHGWRDTISHGDRMARRTHRVGEARLVGEARYVYTWVDGIHLQARLEDEKQCILVRIGATPEGRKELVGFTDGARESAQD
jgi:hypothetical protein